MSAAAVNPTDALAAGERAPTLERAPAPADLRARLEAARESEHRLRAESGRVAAELAALVEAGTDIDGIAGASARAGAIERAVEARVRATATLARELATAEADARRAALVDRLAAPAASAAATLAELTADLAEAHAALLAAVTRAADRYEELGTRRNEFLALLEQLAPGVSHGDRVADEAFDALDALRARGLDLTAVLAPWGGTPGARTISRDLTLPDLGALHGVVFTGIGVIQQRRQDQRGRR